MTICFSDYCKQYIYIYYLPPHPLSPNLHSIFSALIFLSLSLLSPALPASPSYSSLFLASSRFPFLISPLPSPFSLPPPLFPLSSPVPTSSPTPLPSQLHPLPTPIPPSPHPSPLLSQSNPRFCLPIPHLLPLPVASVQPFSL